MPRRALYLICPSAAPPRFSLYPISPHATHSHSSYVYITGVFLCLQAATVSSRLAGAAAKYILGALPSNAVHQTSSMEDASAMLSLVTKDRERLGQKLAAESEAAKSAPPPPHPTPTHPPTHPPTP